VRHQRTLKELKVHRNKLRLVDPNMSWDDVAPRPRRQYRRAANVPLPRVHNANNEPPPPLVVPGPAPLAHRFILDDPLVGVQPNMTVPTGPRDLTPAVPPHAIPLPPTPPPGGSLVIDHQPMDVAPPACPYFLRKRTARSISPTPDRAKRLRIDCLAFAHAWFQPPPGQHACLPTAPASAPPASVTTVCLLTPPTE
jgi:hypothetical protein